jgi:hypothetical protein
LFDADPANELVIYGEGIFAGAQPDAGFFKTLTLTIHKLTKRDGLGSRIVVRAGPLVISQPVYKTQRIKQAACA